MAADNAAVTEILQRLLQTPPTEFVAERNAVVKGLRADGDKDLATTIAVVRRPGRSDWLLNVAAAEHADAVAELVEAANEVIDSQEAAMEGRDAGDLRIRLKLLRVCAASLATHAGGIAERFKQTGAGSSTTDITTRLTEIAANRGALALLERGLLGAEDPGSSDPFGAIGGYGAPRIKRTEPATAHTGAKAKPKREPASPAEKPSGPTAAERKERRAAVATAQKAAASAVAAADAATRAVAKQQSVVAKAEARVTEAEAQLAALKQAVANAADALEAARADNAVAAADVDTAQNALEASERALDE